MSERGGERERERERPESDGVELEREEVDPQREDYEHLPLRTSPIRKRLPPRTLL